MRIGIGGLSCECCTFSPLLTTADDFTIMNGEALLADCEFLAKLDGIEFIPISRARALPGGPIEKEFYENFKASFLEQVGAAGTLDGLLLDMHGAASVVGIDDAEANFYSAIRTAVGPDCMIAASYDLHGNLSHDAVKLLDILTAYRTAPHVDRPETIRRALNLLSRCIRDGRKPAKAFIPLPIILPGEMTSTEIEPAKTLYHHFPIEIDKYSILDASILIGYAWADEPRSSASIVAFGYDENKTHEAAATIASGVWFYRHGFEYGVYADSADGCIEKAMRSEKAPVIISDSGDNPTAGGAGDVPYVLERLTKHNAIDTLYASIADRAAVDLCERIGVGEEATVTLGGKLDPVHAEPLELTGTVISIHDEQANKTAVIRVGGTDVIVTSKRTPFHHYDDFRRLGIDAREYRIIVVKIGYLVPDLEEIAARSLLALSPGAVSQDFKNLPFKRIKRPMFPFDPDMEWQPPQNSIV